MASPQRLVDTGYARGRKYLLDIVNRLRQNAVAQEIDLPTIAVIGNQSAGKSSVIEAASEIKVPRGEGTCTRCPMEIRLRQSDNPWSCQVSLRFEEGTQGYRPSAPFGPCFGKGDDDELEKCLRRAQVAALNPTDTVNKIKQNVTLDDGILQESLRSEKRFSRNVVVVEISGPDTTDLDLIDLPGIIAVDEPDEPGSIDLIKDLAMSYIQKNNCLVLVTITMKDDPKNQHAIMMAKQVDPEGIRTIPVLTKPDTMEEGQEAFWMKLLKNEDPSAIMKHGYYATKQPNIRDRENRITHAQAREKEREYFNSSPWAQMPDDICSRLGTTNLANALSTLLLDHIQKTLPKILKNLDTEYRNVLEKIKKLPPPPSSHPIRDMIGLCDQFKDTLTKRTQPHAGFEKMIQDNRAVYARFGEDLDSTRLDFSPIKPPEESPAASVASDGEDEPTTTLDDLRELKSLDFGDMECFIELCRGRELPDDIPASAKPMLISMSTEKWNSIALDAFDCIQPILQTAIESLVDEVFGEYQHTSLTSHALHIAMEQLHNLKDTTRKELDQLAAIEKTPFTQNIVALREAKVRHLANLKGKIVRATSRPVERIYPQPVYGSDRDATANVISSLKNLGYPVQSPADLQRLHQIHAHERELNMMAEVDAYFDVSSARFLDCVPSTIETNFIFPVAETLYRALLDELGVSDSDGYHRCRDYLAEKPTIAIERNTLVTQKANLDRIKKDLTEFRSVVEEPLALLGSSSATSSDTSISC